MSDSQYVLWFILMAIGIGLLLGLGTLRMAGVLRRHERPAADVHVVHHWYDRFHLHHHAA